MQQAFSENRQKFCRWTGGGQAVERKKVLKTLAPIDREVVATNGQYYTLRIAPYRTTENSIKGLVITIIDSLGAGNTKNGQS